MINPVNPKLKATMEEIKAILKREDIAATIVLCSGEQSEYLNFIAAPQGPSWSALLWNERGLRFKAKAGTGSHVERFRYVSTLKAINSMRNILAHEWAFYNAACEATEQLVEPNAERVHVPHQEES